MNEIRCPECGSLFSIDESSYASIVKQVRDKEFRREVEAQTNAAVSLAEAEKDKEIVALQTQLQASKSELELAVRSALDDHQHVMSEKDQQIAELRAKLEKQEALASAEKEAALRDAESESSKKLTDLRARLSRADAEKELAVQEVLRVKQEEQHSWESKVQALQGQLAQTESSFALREKELVETHVLELRKKEEEVAYYRDLKARMSTKMVGETLEQHCEIEFSRIRAAAFPLAYFEKDNDARFGTKGDFIFRDFDDDGEEYISIMFEMKNEMDETATKHRNEDFLKKLDKDRATKNCEYAVLVSLLEPDNEYYNTGIVDMSYRYPKMYVVRPPFFVPLICILRDAARASLPYKRELKAARLQNMDIEAFSTKLFDFKERFSNDCRLAAERFDDAIREIDNSIDRLQKAKTALLKSGNHLRHANDRAEDLSIKQLTSGSPALAERFNDVTTNAN